MEANDALLNLCDGNAGRLRTYDINALACTILELFGTLCRQQNFPILVRFQFIFHSLIPRESIQFFGSAIGSVSGASTT